VQISRHQHRTLESFGRAETALVGFGICAGAGSRRMVQQLPFHTSYPPTELSGIVRPRPRKLLAFPLAFLKVAQR
jgi:hypothetical protein